MKPTPCPRTVLAGVAFLAGVGATSRSSAQTVTISVDATAAGTTLEKVWPFHGYD